MLALSRETGEGAVYSVLIRGHTPTNVSHATLGGDALRILPTTISSPIASFRRFWD